MKVVVGSKNPVKIKAVEISLKQLWPEETWQVEGKSVYSGVSDQPMSDKESITGAKNRAQTALGKTDADYGVGIEGGLQKIEGRWFTSGWVVVRNKKGEEGVGSSGKVEVPSSMIRLIKEGKELGTVIDMVFGTENAKQAEGHFGLMTNDQVTRTGGYIHGVTFALSRFVHPEIF